MTRLEQDRAAALEASRVSQAEAKRENAKTSHTPGPWTVLPEEADKDYLRIRGTRLGGRYKVANVHMQRLLESHYVLRDRENAESWANARLIAAAPDLLEALQSVWLWAENQSDAQSKGGHETFDLMMLREQRDIARAAIARATGEQP